PVHLVLSLFRKIPLCEYGIARCRFVWSLWIIAYKDHLAVIISGPSLGAHQVITVILFVNVRGLYPDRFFGKVHTSVYDDLVCTGNDLVLFHIVLPNLDYPMSFVKRLFRSVVVHHVGSSVI